MNKEVTLFLENPPEVEASLNGLVLWSALNQHDYERPDDKALTHQDESGAFKHLKFKFDQVVDWREWRHTCMPRLRYARKQKIPHIPELLPHDGKMAIVGAGPSVKQFLPEIAKFRESEYDNIMSINAAHNWLIENGITPRIHVISEFDVDDVTLSLGGPPHPDVVYYIGSTCHPNIFRQLANHKRVLFHVFMPMQGYQEAISRLFHREFMITSGFSTFFKSLAIAAVLGFRHFDLFGVDSSFDESSHLEGYKIANIEPRLTIWAADQWGKHLRKFTTQGGLAFQAKEFLEFCKFNQSGIKLRVHGDSLLQYLHKARYPEQYR